MYQGGEADGGDELRLEDINSTVSMRPLQWDEDTLRAAPQRRHRAAGTVPSVRTAQIKCITRLSPAATESARRETKSQKWEAASNGLARSLQRDFGVETLGNVDQQHQKMILEYHPGGLMANEYAAVWFDVAQFSIRETDHYRHRIPV
ncbi:hypothetical protein DL768_004965 [Monosporascus sp. mg162]|nr:hypothetical protein DL768_004965 [Monosporascus sp. mg162]